MIYIALFGALSILRLMTQSHVRLREQIYPIVLAGLFVFVAFRLEVGCDWYGYYRHFLIQLDQDFADVAAQREPLWWALVQLVGQLKLGYLWLNVFSAAIFFAGVHRLAREQADPLGFVILLFPILIINMPMSGLRQAAAIGLMCFALVSFTRNKPISFALFTIIASGFHSSACIFLLLTALVGRGHLKTRLFASLLLAVPGVFFLVSGESADLAISRYVGAGIDAQGALYRTALLFFTGLGFVTFLRTDWEYKYPNDFRLILFGAVMMMLVLPLVGFSSVIADRLGYYLVPLQTAIFARIPFLELRRNAIVLAIFPYVLLFSVLTVWTIWSVHFNYCYLPYDSWILDVPDHYRYPK